MEKIRHLFMIQLHYDQVNFQYLTHLAIYVRLWKLLHPWKHWASLPCFHKSSIHTDWRVDDVSDDESEWECDDGTTVCDDDDDDDDDDVTSTNGEVSNAFDDGARNVPDLFDLFV